MQSRIRLFLAALVLVPILLYWGFGTAPSERRLPPPEALGQARDAFINQADIRQFNAQGTLTETMVATRIEHDPYARQSLMDEPNIVLIREDSSTIVLTSLHGELSDDRGLIMLAGDVRVLDNRNAQQPALMTTEILRYHTEKDLAETDQKVTFTVGKNIMRSVGMEANLHSSQLRLLSNVRGIYRD
ncbi:LPS export ABC transporter periplasmic protein LptC [Marinobacterium jannaschii]|uniref:LPS export ABC transporter periplasmic protein LptC n=1 Tax=Marinobacterium jannaschii TaxID=64970 RepID=UPI0004883BF5|nr:LPS export ABC transporter periplasmic protein LptC [Marinobacterium jannaschii]